MEPTLSWEDAQTLLAVIDHNSFSGAAKHLQLGQPTISRRIRKLEKLVNKQLFVRQKQGALPTEVALKLLPSAQQMARWAGEFNRTVRGTNESIAGVVRIAAPPGVAIGQLTTFAAQLKLQEPEIRLEILSGVSHLDLSRGDADIAIRTNPPTNPELVALHTLAFPVDVFASPAYCEKIKQPCTWRDLDWITWAKPHHQVAPRPMLERLIPNFEPVFTSDDYLVQSAAAKAGLGAFIMDVASAANQQLQKIDIGVSLPESKIYLVCAKSLQFVPKIAIVAKAMIKAINSNLNP